MRRPLSHGVVEVLLRRQRRSWPPVDLETARSLCGLPLILRNHANKILSYNDPNEPRNTLHRFLFHARNGRSCLGWTHDSTVDHARQMHVVNELEGTCH